MPEIARGSVVKFSGTLAPGASVSYSQAGEWIVLHKCNVNTMMLFRDQDSTGNNIGPRDTWFGEYQSFTLTNADTSRTASYVVWAGTGQAPERLAPQLNKTVLTAPVDVSCGAGALTQLVSAANNQRRVLIQILAGAAGPLRIGGSTTAANRGVALNVGAPQMEVEGSADIYAYNPNGSAVTATLAIES